MDNGDSAQEYISPLRDTLSPLCMKARMEAKQLLSFDLWRKAKRQISQAKNEVFL